MRQNKASNETLSYLNETLGNRSCIYYTYVYIYHKLWKHIFKIYFQAFYLNSPIWNLKRSLSASSLSPKLCLHTHIYTRSHSHTLLVSVPDRRPHLKLWFSRTVWRMGKSQCVSANSCKDWITTWSEEKLGIASPYQTFVLFSDSQSSLQALGLRGCPRLSLT